MYEWMNEAVLYTSLITIKVQLLTQLNYWKE